MLNITLLNPPQSTRYPQPPIGLALLGAILEKEGYPVNILDANALALEPDVIPGYVEDALKTTSPGEIFIQA